MRGEHSDLRPGGSPRSRHGRHPRAGGSAHSPRRLRSPRALRQGGVRAVTGAPRNGGRWICRKKARSPFCPSCLSTRVRTVWKVRQACGRSSGPGQRPPHAAHPRFPFQDLDKFGNEITQLARPLPVEYLIIDVSACPPPVPSGCIGQGGWVGLMRVAPRTPDRYPGGGGVVNLLASLKSSQLQGFFLGSGFFPLKTT